MLNDLTPNYKSLNDLEQEKGEPFVLFFEPPSIDSRIINQFALFALLSNATITFGEWAERHEALCRKIIIPKELKLQVRDKLDQINMTERIIYPGLDGLCRWLRRHYTPTDTIYK